MVSIMNRLRTAQRVAVVKALVEGNSIRSTVRLTGVAKNTVVKLLLELGAACSEFQDGAIRKLTAKRVQCDEIWSFIGAKEKAIRLDPTVRERNKEAGDIWTWTAIDADTKLCISFMIANKTMESAQAFMRDVASRLANRVQLTTDGYKPYLYAVDGAFVGDVDYAQLVKIYDKSGAAGRYSPATCIGAIPTPLIGDPDPKHINTSYVERVNLSMRMGIRRFTRLTNAFSRKIENHAAAVSLYFMWYNFGRVHQTLRVTPAMEAGIANHVWSVEEIVGLLG
jgi:IS1 family transposase